MIADEVVTGFGRLGFMFGCDYYSLKPDLLTVAKGLTSAYTPLSGVIVGERVWRALEQGAEHLGALGHGWTCSAHPLCCAAAIANLDLIDELGLIENAHEVGAYFNGILVEALADHPIVGDVRGEGLMAAVELVEDKAERCLFDPARKVGALAAAAMLERGVIGRAMPQGDILGFAPPLCLTKAEADTIVDAAVGAVEDVANRL